MNREENAAFISSIHAGINPFSILGAGRLIGDVRKNNILYSTGRTLGLCTVDKQCSLLRKQDLHSLPLLCAEVSRVHQQWYQFQEICLQWAQPLAGLWRHPVVTKQTSWIVFNAELLLLIFTRISLRWVASVGHFLHTKKALSWSCVFNERSYVSSSCYLLSSVCACLLAPQLRLGLFESLLNASPMTWQMGDGTENSSD